MKISSFIVGAFLLAASVGPAWAQRPGSSVDQAEKQRAAWLHEIYLQEASAYEFFLDSAKQQKLALRREPVMRWTSENDYNGDVYVWTYQGSAAVVGCIFSGPQDKSSRSVMHELHSLAAEPLRADKKGGSGWLPQEPGLQFAPIPDAPEPAATPTRRLPQMRDLARHFTAQVAREGGKSEMRLLPQPIYRNEATDGQGRILDGALFSFVWTAGTDPEVLLLIEAHPTAQGPRWFYAPVRFTNCEAWLKYENKEVWRAAPSPAGIFDGVTTKPYVAARVKAIPNPAGGR